MPTFTLDDFIRFTREAAGEDGQTILDDGILDRSMGDLGLDSLSIVAIVTEFERAGSIRIHDDFAADATPRDVLEVANRELAAATAGRA